MTVRLYMDVHVPQAITEQLRRRDVDVLTAIEDGVDTMIDRRLLERVHLLGRVIFTQDIGFRVMAQEWQRQNKQFSGLIFGHQLGATIGQYVRDLE
jgi:Domain of unknown function (DUF5615)